MFQPGVRPFGADEKHFDIPQSKRSDKFGKANIVTDDTAAEVAEVAAEAIDKVRMFVGMDTLDFAVRGGISITVEAEYQK